MTNLSRHHTYYREEKKKLTSISKDTITIILIRSWQLHVPLLHVGRINENKILTSCEYILFFFFHYTALLITFV